jgi:hypothetical protein
VRLTAAERSLVAEIIDPRYKTEKEENETDVEGFSLSSLQTYRHTDILHLPPVPVSPPLSCSLSARELVPQQVP